MDGVLLINKPRGWTSFDVVNFVRKTVAQELNKKPKQVKVGHAGTLDPLAEGLLIVLIGNYTKRANEFMKLPKTYDVTMKLGETSTTDDEEGDKTPVSDMRPSVEKIGALMNAFTGPMQQTPPMFSAIKVGGRRAYSIARAGGEVVLEARPILVESNILIDYQYPYVTFRSSVSSGTYIRSLVRDMGEYLKTGAYMTSLTRIEIGKYSLNEAVPIQKINSETIVNKLVSVD